MSCFPAERQTSGQWLSCGFPNRNDGSKIRKQQVLEGFTTVVKLPMYVKLKMNDPSKKCHP